MGKMILFSVLVVGAGFGILTWYAHSNSLSQLSVNASPTPASLANPASQNCEKQGGTVKIQKRGDGGEYGLCIFDDNMACEEWAMYRGDCPVGGIKTTGFDTIEQKYCVWLGGKTLAVPHATCTLSTGKVCSNIDFFQGKCP